MIERATLGNARLLRLAHGKANALDLDLLEAFHAELASAEADAVPGLVITADGPIFSAGVDLLRVRDGGPAYLREFLPAMSRFFARLFFLPLPTLAAIQGHAIAGGGVLALACDRRLMSRGGGRIGIPELKVGVPFPPLVVEIARATLPAPTFQEALLTGALYEAGAARERGFVDEVVEGDALLARAETVMREMSAVPAQSYRLTKAMVRRPAREAYERAGAAEDAAVNAAWMSPAIRDAVNDYVARTLKH